MKLVNQKLIIGFDFDGVIVDHTSAKIKKAKELGYFINPPETASERFKDIIPRRHRLLIQNYIYGKATLEAPPVADAIETIKELSGHYKLAIISRRMIYSRIFALKWLKKYNVLEYIPRQSVFFSLTDKAKNIIAKKIGISVFVDDKTEVLDAMFDVPHKILFDPYCVNRDQNNKWRKIKKWQEFPAMISRFENLS